MQEYLQIISFTLQKVTQLLFSISVGNTNLGSILVTASIFSALIGAILHASIHFGSVPSRIRNSNESRAREAKEREAAEKNAWIRDSASRMV